MRDYPSFNAIIHPVSKKSKITYLINHTLKVPDPFKPQFYTKFRFKVPYPRSADDPPCILVGIYNSHQSVLLRFEKVSDLLGLFNIDGHIQDSLNKALDIATLIHTVHLTKDREKMEYISRYLSPLVDIKNNASVNRITDINRLTEGSEVFSEKGENRGKEDPDRGK